MNSIYNDDLAISNSNKGMNTMSKNSKTEQVSRTANEAECDRFNKHFCERRNWSHFYDNEDFERHNASGDNAEWTPAPFDYIEWCAQFRECGLTRLADRIADFRRNGALDVQFTPAEQADLELAEIALRNLSTQTTGQDDEQEDRASLQAAVDSVAADRDDWRNVALDVTSERDELRVTMAARDAEIDILKDKVKRLEQTAVYLSKHLAYINGMNDATNAQREIVRSMDRVRDTIRDERQANENCIGDIINDLENGNY
jgi:hypothetical protein